MTGTEFLYCMRALKVSMWKDVVKIEALESYASYTTMKFDSSPVSHSRNNHQMEDRIAKLIDMRSKLGDDFSMWLDMFKQANQLLDTLEDGRIILILYYYFLDNQSIMWIADRIDLTYQWTYALMKKGLKVLSDQELPSTGTPMIHQG